MTKETQDQTAAEGLAEDLSLVKSELETLPEALEEAESVIAPLQEAVNRISYEVLVQKKSIRQKDLEKATALLDEAVRTRDALKQREQDLAAERAALEIRIASEHRDEVVVQIRELDSRSEDDAKVIFNQLVSVGKKVKTMQNRLNEADRLRASIGEQSRSGAFRKRFATWVATLLRHTGWDASKIPTGEERERYFVAVGAMKASQASRIFEPEEADVEVG